MRLKKSLLWFFMLVPAVQAQASQQTGYITNVEYTGSRIFISLDGNRSPAPQCNCCPRFELDGSSTTGQSQVAIMLTAYSLHRSVIVNGSGSCMPGPNDTEGIDLLHVN